MNQTRKVQLHVRISWRTYAAVRQIAANNYSHLGAAVEHLLLIGIKTAHRHGKLAEVGGLSKLAHLIREAEKAEKAEKQK